MTTESQRLHRRKHLLLRRKAYMFVRDTIPEVWAELRREVGLAAAGRPKKKKKGKRK